MLNLKRAQAAAKLFPEIPFLLCTIKQSIKIFTAQSMIKRLNMSWGLFNFEFKNLKFKITKNVFSVKIL